MHEQLLLLLLTSIALMLFASYLFHFGLDKLRMPTLLSPLLVGFIFQFIPFLTPFTSTASGDAFYLLSQLGIVFLLLLMGIS